MTGLVRFLILRRWGWFVLTALLAAVAALMLAGAHPLHAVQVDGTIADYQEFTSAGSYDHNELKLTGDERTFRLNKALFHPALPDELVREGVVRLWVDEGSEFVVAITLYDENGGEPHPAHDRLVRYPGQQPAGQLYHHGHHRRIQRVMPPGGAGLAAPPMGPEESYSAHAPRPRRQGAAALTRGGKGACQRATDKQVSAPCAPLCGHTNHTLEGD